MHSIRYNPMIAADQDHPNPGLSGYSVRLVRTGLLTFLSGDRE